MDRGPWARIRAGLQRRVLRRTRVVVVHAAPSDETIVPPAGLALHRIDAASDVAGMRCAERAMRAVDDEAQVVRERLAHGDRLYGWMQDGELVSFIWARWSERSIGPVRLADAPGRCFLYNAHTRAGHRGLGLYPLLLRALRTELGRDGVREFFGEVNVNNLASLRGMERGGFAPVGDIAFLTLADRWTLAGSKRSRATAAACPF